MMKSHYKLVRFHLFTYITTTHYKMTPFTQKQKIATLCVPNITHVTHFIDSQH